MQGQVIEHMLLHQQRAQLARHISHIAHDEFSKLVQAHWTKYTARRFAYNCTSGLKTIYALQARRQPLTHAFYVATGKAVSKAMEKVTAINEAQQETKH